MSKLQFICDVCSSPFFTPLVELEIIQLDDKTHKLVQSEIKRWKCSKCGEIVHSSEIDMSSQKIYRQGE
jgi:hypothetical protein